MQTAASALDAAPPGSCGVKLYGDLDGKVDFPEQFNAPQNTIVVFCTSERDDGLVAIFLTDQLALASEGDDVAVAGPKVRTGDCEDKSMPVNLTVSVEEASGEVDRVKIDVPADYLRRVRISGSIGPSACDPSEVTIDFVGELRADAFHFSEAHMSGEE